MAKNTFQKVDISNFIPSILLITYLCLGFVPNWEAVDKIAPQWLLMSILNTISILYVIYNRTIYSLKISHTLTTKLTVTYIGFIFWAACSYFYAINNTEVLVNISRQLNVLMMYLMMCFFVYNLKAKENFVSYIITGILSIEIYTYLGKSFFYKSFKPNFINCSYSYDVNSVR